MILKLMDRRTTVAAEGWPGPWLALADLETLALGLGRPEWVFDLVLVDDRDMVRLNGDFRDQPEVTDVLSFSSLLTEGTGSPDLSAGEALARRDLWADPADLNVEEGESFPVGEVVLAPEFILARCARNRWQEGTELALLVVHGCLHLLGWEHDTTDDRQAMQVAETEVLRGIGMNHPIIEGS